MNVTNRQIISLALLTIAFIVMLGLLPEQSTDTTNKSAETQLAIKVEK